MTNGGQNMRKRLFNWQGQRFVHLWLEAEPGGSAEQQSLRLFERAGAELKPHGLALDRNIVRSRVYGRTREARDVISAVRGKSFSGTAEHANRRQSVFAAAIKRVKNELRRIRKFEARRELGEAARRALALRRARQFSRPRTTPTSHDGMRSIPSRRRLKKLPPEKIGRVSQANKRAQARRDAKRGRGN